MKDGTNRGERMHASFVTENFQVDRASRVAQDQPQFPTWIIALTSRV